MKRIAAMMLSLLFVWQLLPMWAMAGTEPVADGQAVTVWNGTVASGFASGDGTEENPYIIETAEQLAYLAQRVCSGISYTGKHIALEADILLNSNTANWDQWGTTPPRNSWLSIGNSAGHTFAGTFDGNGHKVKGMYISQTNGDYVGLFGHVSGNVSHVAVGSFHIKGRDYVGGVTGYNAGTLEDCETVGSVNGVRTISSSVSGTVHVGGVTGYNTGVVRDCEVYGSVTGSCTASYSASSSARMSATTCVGGVTGYNTGTVERCYIACSTTNANTSSASSTSSSAAASVTSFVGGVTGYNMGRVSKGTQTGDVTSQSTATTSASSTQQSSPTAEERIGGIVGQNDSEVYGCENSGYISGAVSATASGLAAKSTLYAGGLVGYDSGLVSDCRNIGSVSGKNTNTMGKPTSTSYLLSTASYVYVGGLVGYGESSSVRNSSNSGNLTGKSTNKVSYANVIMGGLVGYLDGTSTLSGCRNTGEMRGNGSADSNYSSYTEAHSYVYAGGVVGQNIGTVDLCYNTGTVEGISESTSYRKSAESYAYVGGVVGRNSKTVSNCYNTGDVYGEGSGYWGNSTEQYAGFFSYAHTGGIVGYQASGGKTSCCYNVGRVMGVAETERRVGGKTGYNDGSLQNCLFVSREGCLYTTYDSPVSEEAMKEQTTYTGFDFDTVWMMSLSDEYAYAVLRENAPYASVTFLDCDGEVISVQVFAKGGSATAPEMSGELRIKNGTVYQFIGWDLAASNYENVTGNLTVRAVTQPFNGFMEVDGSTYYAVRNALVTGYYAVDGHLYYFGEDGKQTVDGVNAFSSEGYIVGDNVFLDAGGDAYYVVNDTVVTNYRIIDGRMYYFGEDGKMSEDGQHDFSSEGYIVGDNVFVTVNGDVYGVVNDTVVQNDYTVVDGHIYYFGEDGKRTEDGEHEFSPEGYIVGDNILVTVKDDVYYIVNNTVVTNYCVIDDRIYYFGEDGKRTEDGEHAFSDEGYIVGDNVFVTVNGDVYCIVNNKVVQNDYTVVDGHIYYFGEDGRQTEDGEHEFSPEGYIVGNRVFVTVKGDVYYMVNSTVVTNYYVIDRRMYYFGEDGKMTEDGEHEFSSEGYIVGDGDVFITVNGDLYCIRNNVLLDGNYAIYNNRAYYFNHEGKMGNDGWHTFSEEGYIVGDMFIYVSRSDFNGEYTEDVYYLKDSVVVRDCYAVIDESGLYNTRYRIYYFGEDGVRTNDGVHEFSDSGYIVGDNVFITVDGDLYCIQGDTVGLNTYGIYDNRVYYFGGDGKATEDGIHTFSPQGYITGNRVFITVSNNLYCIIGDRIVVDGYVIDNRVYYFGGNGALVSERDTAAVELTSLARHVAEIEKLPANLNADLNGDGDVTASDMTTLARMVAGIV